ncbi:MAG: NAD(P)H-dependent oxidoreductase [Sulfuricellaceae bacterium]|nr:NAD(P)H-dependent oxidoreductase [Sulfuricellaceae bacterium]
MKVLIVTAHPRQDSFTQALAERFAQGIAAAGHEAEIANLYHEGFNPVVSIQEMDDWNAQHISPTIQAEQARLQSRDGLVLAYPVWWGTPPAMLTGWMQRVFTLGFAFAHNGGRTEGRLKIPAQLLVNVGSKQREDIDLATLYLEPILGVLRYCGMDTHPTQANWGIYANTDPATLGAVLDEAFENGKRFFA